MPATMPVIPPIKASAFNRSIEIALRNPPDVNKSVAAIKRTINALPDEKLYVADRGDEVSFYIRVDKHQKYISKRSKRVYSLARKEYLLLLQKILELTESNRPADIRRRKLLIAKLQRLIVLYERGHLDLARIVLTQKQYRWFRSQFRQKHINADPELTSSCHIPVRSKSERDIANGGESLAVPFHYEEQMVVYVYDLVRKLEEKLKKEGLLQGQLYSFHNNDIHWIVPPELEWMNMRGSIWRSYDPRDGTIEIFNDFKIMLADDEIIIWEHEGLAWNFIYRCNASERSAVMKYTGTVRRENLIETYERDVDTKEKIAAIIESRILPRLWF